MTIRSNVNIRDINTDYGYFRDAVEAVPQGMFPFAHRVYALIDETIDNLEGEAQAARVPLDKSDSIREVEAMMFDMIRRQNEYTTLDIEQLVGLGAGMATDPVGRERLIANLKATYSDFQKREEA